MNEDQFLLVVVFVIVFLQQEVEASVFYPEDVAGCLSHKVATECQDRSSKNLKKGKLQVLISSVLHSILFCGFSFSVGVRLQDQSHASCWADDGEEPEGLSVVMN